MIILIFIYTIYKKCPLIEFISLEFSPTKDHFIELEKLLRYCQKLKVLFLSMFDACPTDGKELFNVLIRSKPTNLNEIRLFDISWFSWRSLSEFFEEWRGRRAFSIIINQKYIHTIRDYAQLIHKYKNYGVIKNFTHASEHMLRYEMIKY